MIPNGPITVTVLGAAGLIGRRHIEHVLSDASFLLVSIVDPSLEGKQLAVTLRVTHYDDLRGLLENGSELPTAAIIATPSSMHVDQTLHLIDKGVHVLVEKPLCQSRIESLALIEASQAPQAGTILVGFHRRFNPYILRLREALYGSGSQGQEDLGSTRRANTNLPKETSIGQIIAFSGLWCTRKPKSYFLQAPWRTSKSSGGGVIMTNLSHELDLLRFLFGDVAKVYAEVGARSRGFEVEETVAITLLFSCGLVGSLLISDATLSPFSFESATGENPYLARHHEPIYTIMGTSGTMTFPNLTHWQAAGEESANEVEESEGEAGDWSKLLFKSTHKCALPFDAQRFATDKGPSSPFSVRLRHWNRALRGEEPIACTLEDGVQNIRLLDAVRESAEKNIPVNLRSELM